MNRGDVYRIRLARRGGREMSGERFGVIVQSDALLPWSTVLTVPTSTGARASSFRPTIEVAGANTRAVVDQVTALDADRFADYVGRLSPEELWSLDAALDKVLALR